MLQNPGRSHATTEYARDVKVGVGVIVIRQGRVLLGLRQGSHGAGTWALPGGHLEHGEDVVDCAIREVREETGLDIHDVRPGPYTSDVFRAERAHYVTLFVTASCDTGDAVVREPEKCLAWHWFPWNDLPEPLFLPLRSLRGMGFSPA